MKVDLDKWKHKGNRLSRCFLTRDKDDADVRKQIALLETLSVIEKSTASEYSQVYLMRKPDHTLRLCIDFKTLNGATESMETWPLQNIPIMIDRVTQHRPRLYGKVNMTSGFFQIAIDERSRPFTAFITSTSLF
jgi:putative transposase